MISFMSQLKVLKTNTQTKLKNTNKHVNQITLTHFLIGFVAGPEAFGKGLAKGTTSLLKNTLSGVFGSASKFTDAVSGGLVKVGMDDEWERERRVRALKKPQHLGQGLQQGVVGFSEGVFYGVTGVVTQPVKGFREEGTLGLMKGVGKGAAGLVLRPAVGVVDVFTRTAEGLQNMGNYLGDEGKRARVRPPRYIDANEKLLRPYDWMSAARAASIRELKEGRYASLKWIDSFSFFPEEVPKEPKWNVPEFAEIVCFFSFLFIRFPFFFSNLSPSVVSGSTSPTRKSSAQKVP